MSVPTNLPIKLDTLSGKGTQMLQAQIPPASDFDPVYEFANEVKGDRQGGGGLITYLRTQQGMSKAPYIGCWTMSLVQHICGTDKRSDSKAPAVGSQTRMAAPPQRKENR